jgi:predicted ABC-type transport system involved in lysophospholipase L1 biosynthesis ATPase subunit
VNIQQPADLIVARELSRVIGSPPTEVRILDDVSLRVPRHSLFAINGPSGSGKSTLLNLLTGIDHPTSGEVIFDGRSLVARGENALARWRATHSGSCSSSFISSRR